MVRYIRDVPKDATQRGVLSKLDELGFRINEGIDGAIGVMAASKGAEVAYIFNFFGIAIDEWFEAFPDQLQAVFKPEFYFLEDAYRLSFLNGKMWSGVAIGVSMAVDKLATVLNWFLHDVKSPIKHKYPNLVCPFKKDDLKERMMITPLHASYGGGCMVPAQDLMVCVDVYACAPVPPRHFSSRQGGEGETLVRASFGEHVIEIDAKQSSSICK